LNPTSEEIVNKRWIHDLEAHERSMLENIPLPNQQKKQGKKFGPRFHRMMFLFVVSIIIITQDQIQSMFEEINIMNEMLRIMIQFLLIIIFLGLAHRSLNFN
jgi:hypothetical protein